MQYALIKANKVENVIVAEIDFIDHIRSQYDHIEAIDTLYEQNLGVGIGWQYINGEFLAPQNQQVTQTLISKKITKLAFMNRFTDAEAIAIDLASYGNTVQAAAMRRYKEKITVATYIDLDKQDTRDGVIALEALGLLAAGRATEILDAQITPEEAFKI